MENLQLYLREAVKSVEDELASEDKGWLTAASSFSGLTSTERRIAVNKARRYYDRDPLAHHAVRMWTDYTFGYGVSWSAKDEGAADAFRVFWDAPANKGILSTSGQIKLSNRLLVDGEVFLALFLGHDAIRIRPIDPMEVVDFISDPEDHEDVRYYWRSWLADGHPKEAYYCSLQNSGDEPVEVNGKQIRATEEKVIVIHLAINTLGQRGNSLLLPALSWIEMYRRFLAARVAVILALARFAWKVKVAGGEDSVSAVKGVYEAQKPAAGSTSVENEYATLEQIKVDSGAAQAYQDGRMVKLQVCAATGIPEQYFGDISIGNLATARTVELPLQKQFESYQAIWRDTLATISDVVLEASGVAPDKRYIDWDFPAIAPEEASVASSTLEKVLSVFPEFASSKDVKQQAMMMMGVKDVNEALDQLVAEAKGDPQIALAKAIRQFREAYSGRL